MALPALNIRIPDATPAHAPTTAAARDAVLPTYKRSLEIARGEGVYLIDVEGNRYLDFVSGIAVNALG
jgi:4-aminobutyrate aminotransferase-like enzyme